MRNAQDRGEAPLVPTPRTTTMTALGKQVFVSEVNEIKQVDQFDDYDPRSTYPRIHFISRTWKRLRRLWLLRGESSLHQVINVINRAIILIIVIIVIIIINHGYHHTVGSHQVSRSNHKKNRDLRPSLRFFHSVWSQSPHPAAPNFSCKSSSDQDDVRFLHSEAIKREIQENSLESPKRKKKWRKKWRKKWSAFSLHSATMADGDRSS